MASSLRIGIVVPHIFMHRDILPHVIFSPAGLALQLADGLVGAGQEVTLFSPGPVDTNAHNITADLRYFQRELSLRGDSYIDLLKKHPLTFITLARQVQAELIALAYAMANEGKLDVIHIYTNEEEIALPFAKLCNKPVVFTHHDPFNFLVKYKNNFPKYAELPWISLSRAQRKGMPANTNWLANIYHGLPRDQLQPLQSPSNNYIGYLGRIIEPKGVHLAAAAVELYNQRHPDQPITLRIAGKHYSGNGKDTYWQERINPRLGEHIMYDGFVKPENRQTFIGNARALIVPSIFEEPFGMVVIEALACGTPVIGLDSGAIPEIIASDKIGSVVRKRYTVGDTLDTAATSAALAESFERIDTFDRIACRQAFEARFTADRMVSEHVAAYAKLTAVPDQL